MSSTEQQILATAATVKNHVCAFSTERFDISLFVENDQALFCDLYTNDNVMRYIEPTLSQTAANKSFKSILKSMKKDSPIIFMWSITLKSSGKKVGLVALSWSKWPQAKTDPIFQTGKQPQVGIVLKEEVHGKGYANEAMRALIDYTHQLIPSVILDVFYYNENIKSKQLFKSLGCTLDNNRQPIDSTLGHQTIPAAL